ncbi:DNAation factor subunit beta [Plakobranchus ocellatus]|uniref:DNAation factor subunit beta n=1 Tax=Plakobranchus ocellatus TaxID=259542 RepID=A0AAV4CG24_9GAST|nr:DNAation factor subunit beta [Plakobranchus ocellatus]
MVLEISGNQNVRVISGDDKTEVKDDEDLKKRHNQTSFVFLMDGERWPGDVYHYLNEFWMKNTVTQDDKLCFEKIIRDEQFEKRVLKYLEIVETNIHANRRNEDEDWFHGLGKRHKTKNKVMRDKLRRRMRNYLSKAGKKFDQEKTREMVQLLETRLKNAGYNSSYYDRGDSAKRMCDELGEFRCEGRYNKDECEHQHTINPYASKDHRVMFRLWDLDHM